MTGACVLSLCCTDPIAGYYPSSLSSSQSQLSRCCEIPTFHRCIRTWGLRDLKQVCFAAPRMVDTKLHRYTLMLPLVNHQLQGILPLDV
jgi:hypothetical protein